MKALSIRNPYSYLVAYGAKDVENRTWTTKYRGPMLIHVSGPSMIWPTTDYLPKILQKEIEELGTDYNKWPKYFQRYDLINQAIRDFLKLGDGPLDIQKIKKAAKKIGYPMRGQSIIGQVDLVDIVRDSDSPWAEPNQFHWIIDNPKLFHLPIFGIKGKLRLWEFEGELPELLDF